MKKLILLSGLPRSGTTWVTRVIGKSPSVNYLSGEPMNYKYGELEFGQPFEGWYKYIEPGSHEEFFKCLKNSFGLAWSPVDFKRRFGFLMKKKEHNPVLYLRILKHYIYYLNTKTNVVKDPALFFSIENLYKSLGCQIVLLHRHPAAFVSSMIRMNWDFDFAIILTQDKLVNKYLKSLEPEIRDAASDNRKERYLDRLILLWRIYSLMILDWKKNYGDKWIFINHESLAQNPHAEFHKLFRALSISEFSGFDEEISKISGGERTEARTGEIHDLDRNSRKVAGLWRQRLSKDQVGKIRIETSGECASLYPEPLVWNV